MSGEPQHRAPGAFVVWCPACGERVLVEGVWVRSVGVSPFKTREGSQKLRIDMVPEIDQVHDCDPRPDTDGLEPIERFIRHGALDDQGRDAR